MATSINKYQFKNKKLLLSKIKDEKKLWMPDFALKYKTNIYDSYNNFYKKFYNKFKTK